MQASTAESSSPSLSSAATQEIVNKNRLAEVIPGLWIGSLAAVTELRKLPRAWTVISILSSPKLTGFIHKSLQELKEHGQSVGVVVTHVEWELKDQCQAQLISLRLEEILVHMDQTLLQSSKDDSHTPERACLVHCAFGISRSASVCAAWLLSRRRYTTMSEALSCLRKARPEVSPNMGFLAGLLALEKSNGNVQAAMERMKGRHTQPADNKEQEPL
jgi:hypothetical protein